MAFRAHNSPFDRWLRENAGEDDADDSSVSSDEQLRGLELFYGRARCARCHSGPFQSDQKFHAIAMPQIGPGKGDGPSRREDTGRRRVTGISKHGYQFRTPSLRNVALTGPWGHAGAYETLEEVVRHHLRPQTSLFDYDPNQAVLPPRDDLDAIDFVALYDRSTRAAIASTNKLRPVALRQSEVADLIAFLYALTEPASLDLHAHVPFDVPSNLPVFD
ncbi:MAG: cytochrome-c peroxidase [Gammaproteobacteria bacterium]